MTGLPSLADDTGLEVDALEGAPGIYSARYAGEDATFNDNINKLLKELEGIPNARRTARFRTVVSFVDDSTELYSEGIVEGTITLDRKGNHGFGYDPIFLPRGHDLTFSEMDQMVKNEISHRGKALMKMKNLFIKKPQFKLLFLNSKKFLIIILRFSSKPLLAHPPIKQISYLAGLVSLIGL